jgi:hypothetical protein
MQQINAEQIILATILTIGLWLTIMVHEISYKIFRIYPKKVGIVNYLTCPYCFGLPLSLASTIIVGRIGWTDFKQEWLLVIASVLIIDTLAGLTLQYFRRNGWFETHYETYERKQRIVKNIK